MLRNHMPFSFSQNPHWFPQSDTHHQTTSHDDREPFYITICSRTFTAIAFLDTLTVQDNKNLITPVMEWVLTAKRQVYLCLDACCIVWCSSRLGLPMPIYLLHSYLLQTLMRVSPHKCLPSRVEQPLFPLLTTVVSKECQGRSCGYGLLWLGYASMEQLSTGTWNCLVQDCYCIPGNHRHATASGYLLSHVNIWCFRASWPI